jgi:hypothetical protein
VLAVWTAVEIYTEGLDGAFGGLFAGYADALEAPAGRASPNRATDAFQRAYNKSESRVDALLEKQDPGE